MPSCTFVIVVIVIELIVIVVEESENHPSELHPEGYVIEVGVAPVVHGSAPSSSCGVLIGEVSYNVES